MRPLKEDAGVCEHCIFSSGDGDGSDSRHGSRESVFLYCSEGYVDSILLKTNDHLERLTNGSLPVCVCVGQQAAWFSQSVPSGSIARQVLSLQQVFRLISIGGKKTNSFQESWRADSEKQQPTDERLG